MIRETPPGKVEAPLGTGPLYRREFLAPRYWLTWLMVAGLWFVARLPHGARMVLGGALGIALMPFMAGRRRIARVNLELCFPELSPGRRRRLLRRHFVSLGIGLLDMGAAWWGRDHQLRDLVRVTGVENVEEGLARGRGVILVSPHFTSMELGLRLYGFAQPTDITYIIYRPQKNRFLEHVITRGRSLHRCRMFPREDVRTMTRALKANHPVWFAPDQDHGRRHAVFVPFFGVPAATLTTTSRFARMTGAAVVPIFFHRLRGRAGYEVVLLPPLDEFPSGDDEADTARLNRVFEEQIRRSPEQYWWLHRRFKTRPENAPDVYRRSTVA